MFYTYNEQLDKTFQWSWKKSCQEKQYWKTWIQKKSDIQLINVPKEHHQIVLDELWEDMQEDIQHTRGLINKQRREKRLANKNKV